MPAPLSVELPSDREILITRDFDGPADLVFACWTQPKLVRRWLTGPDGWEFVTCEIDLRVGGKYRFVWKNVDGVVMGMGGTYREIKPAKRLVSSELFDEDWTGGETISTIDFIEEGKRTRTLNRIVYSSKEARDGALKTGMADGMEAGYRRLDTMLADGPAKV
ncbi:MAG TPA: SRPBCC family protein [Rhizobiaceae bacterium]|nr:SRPBCC family protein [Rhizobiaceae bacterium]